MKKITFPILLLLSLLPSMAQSRQWTLKECIDHALENNITLKQDAILVQQNEVSLNTATMRVLPGISASASENLSFGRGLTEDNTYTNSNTSSTSFSLGGEIPLFSGLEIYNGIRLARLDLESATMQLEKAKDDIRVAVAQAYVQILYAQEILKVAQSQAAHDEELLEAVKVRRDAGRASDSEVSAQMATLAQSRYSEIQARGDLDMAILELTQLLELPSPEGFSIEAPSAEALQGKLLMSPEEVYAEALGVRPAVKVEEIRLNSAKVAIAKAKSGYLPTLSLSGGIGTNFYTASGRVSNSFASQMANNFSQYVGLSLSIPIFDRLSTRNAVRTAKMSYDSQALQLESVKKSLYKEIQQAYYNAVTAQAKVEGSDQAALSAEQHYHLTEEKYLAGKSSVTDYNDARNSYLRAVSDQIRSRYEALYQASLLDFYRGVDLGSSF